MTAARNKTPVHTSLPFELGYRMPAEWEPHEATWIAWPHNVRDWPGKFVTIPWVYADIVKKLCDSERVCIVVQHEEHEQRARRALKRAGVDLTGVRFFRFPTDRVWTRDSGPIFIKTTRKGQEPVAALNWRFNAWAKYPDWKRDDLLADAVAKRENCPVWTPVAGLPPRRVVLEGGSIDVNGAGLMLTTEECLLSKVQERNPGLSCEDLELVFRDYLGVQKVIWLHNGIAGDDTHGHVDDLARFADPNTIVLVSEDNREDANYEPLRENLMLLRKARNLDGKPFRILTLPMPAPVVFDGVRLPASYANFYIANTVVLVPTFNDPNDRIALGILQKLFPRRRVTGVHALDLVWGLGTLHCMTQQQPWT